jgi:hypothetical protein
MAHRGRPTVEIDLSAGDRATLERWARRHSSPQTLGALVQGHSGLRGREDSLRDRNPLA